MGGCVGSKSTYGVPAEEIEQRWQSIKSQHGCDVLIMAVKDQNQPGKLCLAGDADQALISAITGVLKQDSANAGIEVSGDKYDLMWNYTIRNTKLTSGHSSFSLAKAYFPRGKLLVQLLDAISGQGWGLAATPNFGGVEARDKNGNAVSTVDWPIFVFYREKESLFENQHLFLAVKDSNVPGKLCAAGPVGELEQAVTTTLQQFKSDVKSEKDSYDDDYDVVWRNTSITSGMSAFSLAKAYFPKGKTNVALLQTLYQYGWRCVAAPNFGGQGDSWPCLILRKLKEPGQAPEVLFGSIKDSNQPGKLCWAGPSADRMADTICGALAKVTGNDSVKNEKDSYDEDYDAVCRNVKITTGMQAFSFRLAYFPRGDSMKCFLNTMTEEGWQIAACPNFGGMQDSWPTFIFEKAAGSAPRHMFLAVKDDNIPGKLDFVGGDIAADSALSSALFSALRGLCGENVTQTADDYDQTYELAFRNTVLTTGHATLTWSKPYWPHGLVLVAVLQILLKSGWKAAGGPNFGDSGNQWPGIIFQNAA